MPSILAQVTFEHATGLSADRVVNTFAFNQIGEEQYPAVATALANFYNAVPPGQGRNFQNIGTNLAPYLSPVLDNGENRSTVKIYEIAGAGVPMGSPEHVQSFTLESSTTAAIPSEVAMVVTLETSGRADAPVEGGGGLTRPKQRHTGRVFLGPLSQAAVDVVGGITRPMWRFQDVALLAMVQLDTAVRAVNPTADLAVWSRKDNAVRSVGFVSVDDSFDTQRRRGEGPTSRRRIPLTEA